MNIPSRAINLLVKGSQLSSQKLNPLSKCTRNLINSMPAPASWSTTSTKLFHTRSFSWKNSVGSSSSLSSTVQDASISMGKSWSLRCRSSLLVDSLVPSFQKNLRIYDGIGEQEQRKTLFWTGSRCYSTLWEQHVKGPHKKFRPPRKPLDGAPMLKGVVLKTLIKKPKKPNSANRKCVLVRLSNGKERVAYVPGIGHNLQEHNVVLVRCGRLQDVPGVKLKCIRGKYDLPHVIKQQQK